MGKRYRVVHLPAADERHWGVMDTRLAYVRVRYKAEHHARHTAELLNQKDAALDAASVTEHVTNLA